MPFLSAMNTFNLHFILKCCCILLFLFVYNATTTSCNFNIKLIQTLHNEGFHRNITYDIDYGAYDGNKDFYEDCSVGLEQVLPAGLFASPDELEELRYKTRTIFKSKVDVEISAELASPITVHLLGTVQSHKTFLSLPVHARYHKSVAGGGYVSVDIPPPLLYINCGPKKFGKCSGESLVNSFCPKNLQYKCPWIQVPVGGGAPLSWKIPRGNTQHHNLVWFGTVAVVCFGSLYILKEIHCHKSRQNKQ
ncbi:uncharacterized protein LOC125048674 [Pieris napi]|uniref:uncharacterized protein LOC125048674 n=1 Tax=Pieris napi TaxID=78633 RepID=UPI001FBAF7EB|nr:uncharacterized protein LOC125048674 [Pieris napi]